MDVGDGLLTGDAEPLGDPNLRIIVDDIVFLAACFALSVLTKLVTSSSRLPFRLGDASSSSGPTSVFSEDGCVMWVMDDPLAGDSLVEDVGEDTVLCLGDDDESDGAR